MPSLVDAERPRDFDGSFLLFYSTYVGPSRPAMKQARQFGYFPGGAHRIHFHAAVIQIPRVAGESEFGGGALREVAISHALHAAAHPPAACV